MTKLKDLQSAVDEGPGSAQGIRRAGGGIRADGARWRRRARARASARRELARRMKTTQSTIARLESGRGMPSTRTLGAVRQGDGAQVEDQLRAGAEEDEIVGWVERSETHQVAIVERVDGFRCALPNPTCYG